MRPAGVEAGNEEDVFVVEDGGVGGRGGRGEEGVETWEEEEWSVRIVV